MGLIFQYAIVALVFVIALVYMINKFMPSKNKQQGCDKGCGCSMTAHKK